MGAGHGGGYGPPSATSLAPTAAGSAAVPSLQANIAALESQYPRGSDGRFGVPDVGRSQVIVADNHHRVARNFYKALANGGHEKAADDGKRVFTAFADGSNVQLRPTTSSPDSPAVDIMITGQGADSYKIHFKPLGYTPKGKK